MSIEAGSTSVGRTTALHRDARRFEGGSINTAGVCGLDASIAFLNTIGMDEVEREVLRIAGLLATRLAELGFGVRSQVPQRSGIVAVTPPPQLDLATVRRELRPTPAEDRPDEGAAVRLLHGWLERHGVICSAREGMLRFSPHVYNDDAEVERVIELLGSLV
jgi:cysteine desulfurase/selenocysteine lyase